MKIKFLLRQIRARFKSNLPRNEVEHAAWAGDILELAGLPDNDSFRHALASMVLHLNAGVIRVPKYHFIKELVRSIANQAAYNIMMDLKNKEKAEREKEAAEPKTVN